MTGLLQLELPLNPPPTRTGLFVETSAQVDLVFGSGAVKHVLENILAVHDTETSTYVLMEFRRTAVHALRVVRALADQVGDESALVPELIRRIERGESDSARLLSPRQRSRCRGALVMVLEAFGTSALTRKEFLDYVDGVVHRVEDTSWLGIRFLSNNTDCDLVRPDRTQSGKWPMSCDAQAAECAQRRFLGAHHADLSVVLATCENDPDFDDHRMLTSLRPLVTDKAAETRGQTRCWRLADLLIALEARSSGRVLTSNAKHFAPICAALGVEMMAYNPYLTG